MKHSSFQLTQSHASNFCYTQKETQKKIQLHFSPLSPQSFFLLDTSCNKLQSNFFFCQKEKNPDERYRKSYNVYSNRDAMLSEIFVSVLSIFEAIVQWVEFFSELKYFHISTRSKLNIPALTLPFSSVFSDSFSITLLYSRRKNFKKKISKN